MGAGSPAEVAARVVAALIDMAERRAETIAELSPTVAQAVREIDPDGLRDSTPTWFREHPWMRPDAFDRFRLAHDDLLILEAQAGEVVKDLQGSLALRPVGSHERPVGYSPARANAVLMGLASRRLELLRTLRLTERLLRDRMTAPTAARLRRTLRVIAREEEFAAAQQSRLTVLLTFTSPPAKAS